MSLIRTVTVVAAFCLSTFDVTAQTNDYLPDDLRLRVEQLKTEFHTIETDRHNASARAHLAWEWLNAYALNGGYMPVNATLAVAAVLGRPPVGPASIAGLNSVIEELSFLDDNPDAIGSLTADTGPFPVASFVTISQTYTVGRLPVQTGGGFMVARHFMANFGQWQASDPAADHYISVSSSNPKVTFVVSRVPMGGMHGGFRNTRPTLMFKVASGTLVQGDTVTITYGDTSGGSRGIMTPSFSSDRMPLPLYLAFVEDSHFMSLPIQPVVMEGTDVAGVNAFLPSVVSPGETFEFSVRAQDRYFNRATGTIPDWTVYLNGSEWLTLESNGVITTHTTQIDEPGVYHVTVRSSDGSIAGSGNPVLVTDEERDRIYWGDTHGHSGFAEGIGTPDRFMIWARDDARLDYVTHSEHDIWLDDSEWEVLQANVRAFSEEGRFIAYLGYEWTVSNTRGGHHNVLFRRPDHNRIPAQFYPTLSKLYQGLRTHAEPKNVVVIPHAHQAGDYRLSDPELEPLVEIMSQHGNFEWFGRLYLQHGHQVGFVAASDNHLSQPGYSAPLGGSLSQRGGLGAIMARERTTDAIFDGMKNLRAYATTGDRMILDFSVNDAPMGTRTPFEENRAISGRVIGTAPIDTITIIKNEDVLWSESYLDNKDARTGREDTFLLSFASDSTPFHRGDNPRGWRAWEGTLEVIGADLVNIEAYDASFPLQNVTRTDEANRVIFNTKTRGDTSSFLIELANITRTARLQFDIVENRETGGGPPIYRQPQRVAAVSFAMALRDMEDGKVEYTQTVDAYTDRATLRRIITDGPREVSFNLTDTGNRQGDYYFVRVVQANDAIAWSSPVWVGGYNKK